MKTASTTSHRLSSARLSVWLFLLLWFAYCAAINSSNLLDFDLQHVGVQAMVERGHFYLEHSIPSHRHSKGDVFTYGGHNYAAIFLLKVAALRKRESSTVSASR